MQNIATIQRFKADRHGYKQWKTIQNNFLYKKTKDAKGDFKQHGLAMLRNEQKLGGYIRIEKD